MSDYIDSLFSGFQQEDRDINIDEFLSESNRNTGASHGGQAMRRDKWMQDHMSQSAQDANVRFEGDVRMDEAYYGYELMSPDGDQRSWLEVIGQNNPGNLRLGLVAKENTGWGALHQEQQEDVLEGFVGTSSRGYQNQMHDLVHGRIGGMSWSPLTPEGEQLVQSLLWDNRDSGMSTNLYHAVTGVATLGFRENQAERVKDAIMSGKLNSYNLQDVETGKVYKWEDTSPELRVELFAKQGPQAAHLVERAEMLGLDLNKIDGLDAAAWQSDLLNKSNAAARANFNKRWAEQYNWFDDTVYFGQMLVAEMIGDPDEAYLTAATMGVGTAANIGVKALNGIGSAALKGGLKIAAKGGSRARIGYHNKIAKGAARVGEFVVKHQRWGSLSDLGGTAVERTMARFAGEAGLGTAKKTMGYVGGLAADGFVQGTLFYGYNSAAMVEVAQSLYGDSRGMEATTGGYFASGALGAALSIGIGTGMGAFSSTMQTVNKNNQLNWTGNWAKKLDYYGKNAATAPVGNEADMLRMVYGEDAPAGVRATEAMVSAEQDALWSLATMTGEAVDAENNRAIGLARQAGIPVRQVSDFLLQLAGENTGNPMTMEAIQIRLAEFTMENMDPASMAEGITPEGIVAKANLLTDSNVLAAHQAGMSDGRVDPNLEGDAKVEATRGANLKRAEMEQKRVDKKREEAKEARERLDDTRENVTPAEQATVEGLEVPARDGGLKVDQLRKMAKQRGIKGYTAMRRQELVDAIATHDATPEAEASRAQQNEATELALLQTEAQVQRLEENADAMQATVDSARDDIADGKFDDKPYTPAAQRALDGKKAMAELDGEKLEEFAKKAEDSETVSSELVKGQLKQTSPELPSEEISGKEAAKLFREEAEALKEDAEVLSDGDLGIQLFADMGGNDSFDLRREMKKVELEAANQASQAGATPQVMGDPSLFRAPVMRDETTGAIRTQDARNEAKQKNKKWSVAEDITAVDVALARLDDLNYRSEGGVQMLTYDAVKALFADTVLHDVDIDIAFAEAKINDASGREGMFSADEIHFAINTRRASVDPEFAAALRPERSDRAAKNPYLVEQRVYEALSIHHAAQARAEFEASGNQLKGADSEVQWVATAKAIYEKAMGKRTSNKGWDVVLEELGINPEDFANGTLDYLDPKTFAQGLIDVANRKREGTRYHREVIEQTNEDGSVEVIDRLSSFPAERNSAMPYSSRQWVERYEDAVAFHRRRAILDWDPTQEGAMSREEVKEAMTSGELRQEVALDPKRVHKFGGRLVPSELFTNPDKELMTLEEAIEQAQVEMLEMDSTDYDMIHDDFGTRQGEWGIPADYEGGRHFENHGFAGGFPLATILPTPDGSRSMGMAVLDAHTLLFPEMMFDAREAAMARGEEAAARGVDAYMGRNIDGAQNGVRHALAFAYADSPEVQAMIKATDSDVDFYVEVRDASNAKVELDAPTNKTAMWWKELGIFSDEKAGRKFSKKPVMTKPYGAGKKALRNHIKGFVMDLPADKREGIDVNEVVDYLTNVWYGNKKQKEAGILNDALGLPENDEFLARLAMRVAKGELHPDLDSPRAMMEFALEKEEATGISADTWLMGLQMQKAAQAMGLTTPEVQAVWKQNMEALAEPKSLLEYRQAQASGELNLFEQVMGALNRTPFELDPAGNAEFTRRATGQSKDQLNRRLAPESQGEFYWSNIIDYRTRMYIDSVLLNPKGAKAGRHSATLETLPEMEGFQLKDGVTEEQYNTFVKAVNEGRMSRDNITDYVKFEGLGGQFRPAEKRSVRKQLAEEFGEGTPEFEKAMQEERDRVETLVLKQVMLDASADFVPPVLERDLNEGEFVQMDRAMDASSTKRHESALELFNDMHEEDKAAVVSHMGLPKLDPRRTQPISRQEFDDMDIETRRSVDKAQGLHQLDTEMENRPLHTVIGIPGLAAAAKRATKQDTVAMMKGMGGPTRQESAKKSADQETIPARREMFSTDERLRIDHTDSQLLPLLDMSERDPASALSRTPEQAERFLKAELTQYAKLNQLGDLVKDNKWGEIWTHRMVSTQLKRVNQQFQKAMENARTPEAKAATISRFGKMWREWIDEMQKPAVDVIEGEFNTLTVDPKGAIKVVPGRHKGERLSIAEQLRRSIRKGGNVEAVTGQTSPMGLRKQPLNDPRLGTDEATQPIFLDAMDVMTDDGTIIQAPRNRSENKKMPVHVVHGTDATAIRLAIALREGMNPVDAIGEQTLVMSMEELQAGLELGLIDGADANTRFFTKDGIEVVMPIVQGANARRALSRGERYNIMMQTKNNFLARRLDLAAKLELEGLSVGGERTFSSNLDFEKMDPTIRAAEAKEQMELMALRRMGDPLVNGPGAYDSLSGSFQPRLYETLPMMTAPTQMLGIAMGPLQNRFADLGFKMELDTKDFALAESSRIIGAAGKNKDGLIFRILSETKKGEEPRRVSWAEMSAALSKHRNSPIVDTFASTLFEGAEPAPKTTFTVEEVKAAWKKAKKAELKRLNMIEKDMRIMPDNVMTAAAMIVSMKMRPELAMELMGVKTTDEKTDLRMATDYLRRMVKQAGIWEFQGANGWNGIEATIKLMETHPEQLPLVAPETPEAQAAEAAWLSKNLIGVAGMSTSKDGISVEQGALILSRARQALVDNNVEMANFNNGMQPWQTFTDADGNSQSPEWFMESDNYETIGAGHRQFNDFLEEGIESGAIDTATARILRVATAGTDDPFLASLGFGWVDKDQIQDLDTAGQIWGETFTTAGAVGIRIRRDVLSAKGSLGMADVILHELGHGGVETFIRGDRVAWGNAVSLMESPEGAAMMKEMTKQMFGGRWTKEAKQAYEYFSKSEHGVEEFLAQMFSFTTMAKSFEDQKLVTKAFNADSSSTIKNILAQIANYVYRKLQRITAVLGTTDPAIQDKLNALVNQMHGKTDQIPATQFTPNMTFFSASQPTPVAGTQPKLTRIDEIRQKIDDGVASLEERAERWNLITEVATANNIASREDIKTRTEEDFDTQYRQEDSDPDYNQFNDDPEAIRHFVFNPIEKMTRQNQLDPSGAGNMIQDLFGNAAIGGSRSWAAAKLIMGHSSWNETLLSQDAVMRMLSAMVDHQSVFSGYNPLTDDHVKSLHQVKQAVQLDFQPNTIAIQKLRAAFRRTESIWKRTNKAVRFDKSTSDIGTQVEDAIQRSLEQGTSLQVELDTIPFDVAGMMEEIKMVHKTSAELIDKTKQMMVESGAIDKEVADRLPGLPFKLNKQAMYGDAEATKKVYQAFKDMAAEALMNSDRVDLLTLQLLGMMPNDMDKLNDWWNSNNIPEHTRAHIEKLAINSLMFPKRDEMEKMGIQSTSVDLDKLRAEAKLSFELDPKVREAALRSAVRDLQRKINRRQVTRLEFFGSDRGSQNNYQNGITSSRNYVPGWENLLRESGSSKVQPGKGKGFSKGIALVGTSADSHGRRIYQDLQRTGRFVRNNDLLSHATIKNNPVVKPYVDNDLKSVMDGLRKGAYFDEMSKRDIRRGLGIKGMTHDNLIEKTGEFLATQFPQRENDIREGIRMMREAYQSAAGRRQSFEADANKMLNWLGRNASSIAMTKYGANLGFAQLAETTAMFADRARLVNTAPSFTQGIMGMAEGLSARKRRQLAKTLTFTTQHINSEINTRYINTEDDSTAAQSWLDKLFGNLGEMNSRFGGSYLVNRFNKTMSGLTGMQMQSRDLNAAIKLADLLAEAGEMITADQFKQLSAQAGFGRRFSDAMRWRENGLLKPERMRVARQLLNEAQVSADRGFWDPDVMNNFLDNHVDHPDFDLMVEVKRELLGMLEDYVAKINVEPRLMDTNFSDSGKSAYHRTMDVYLAWPRAFYTQRMMRSGRFTMGEWANLLGGQYVWDTFYRATRSMMSGSLAADVIHEWETDPIGRMLQNAFMLPVLGGYSWIPDMAVGIARDMAAGSSLPVGYADPRVWNIDILSSPAGAALNAVAGIGIDMTKSVYELSTGQATLGQSAMKTLSSTKNFVPLINNMALSALIEQYITMQTQQSYSKRGYKRYYDYLNKLHMKRAKKKWGSSGSGGSSNGGW